MKKIFLLLVIFVGIITVNAQTKEELKAEKSQKQAVVSVLQGEVKAIQAKIDALSGWRTGAFGTIGGSLSGFDKWYAQGVPNNSSGNIGFTLNGFANLIQPKFFWRNALTTNLNWVKLNNKDNPFDSDSFEPTTDVFNMSSLYGRNLTKRLAVSGLLEYRTTILDNFNNPSYLDLGVGATWTPINNLVVVIHPLNYNFIFSSGNTVFESSLGAKIVADYTRQIGNVNFKTNVSMFNSYKSSDFSNWTWSNSFSYTLWKSIGVGFDFGLRNNKQEALNYITTLPIADGGDPTTTFATLDNKLQSFYTVGLSYKF